MTYVLHFNLSFHYWELSPAFGLKGQTGKTIVTASGTIFAKTLGVDMTGKKTDRHGERTIFAKMLGVGMTK